MTYCTVMAATNVLGKMLAVKFKCMFQGLRKKIVVKKISENYEIMTLHGGYLYEHNNKALSLI